MDFFKYLKDDEKKRLFGIKRKSVARHVRWYHRKLSRYHSLEELKELGFDVGLGKDFFDEWKQSYESGEFGKIVNSRKEEELRFLVENVDLSHVTRLELSGRFEDLSLLKGFKNLKQLRFVIFNLSGKDWSWLKQMKNLKYLGFEGVYLEDDEKKRLFGILDELKQVLKNCRMSVSDMYGKDIYSYHGISV
jgi:hypothetical protein